MTVFAMGTPGNRPLEMDDLITPIQQVNNVRDSDYVYQSLVGVA